MKTAVKSPESADYRRGLGIFLTETPPTDTPKHLFRPLFPRNPLFPASDPGSYTGTDSEYFAHFSGSTFTARTDIAAFSASGYRPGVATASAVAETIWGFDLSYGTDYRMVVGYDFTTGLTSLWIDPTAITDTSVTSTTARTGITLDAFNFRQSAATPDQDISIGQLRVATTFDEVLVPEPSTYALLVATGIGAYVIRRRRR